MDFQCFVCSDLFKSINEIIDHLRKTHSINESTASKIPCLVKKTDKCDKKFQTFSGLRKHTIKCIDKKSKCAAKHVLPKKKC